MDSIKFKDQLIKNNSLEIKIIPNSRKNNIISKDNKFIIEISQPAENNKANQELIRYLKKITGKEIKIIKGKTSKNKTIKIV